MECGALAIRALEPDAPALHFDETLRYVQAQAGAGHFARLLIFGAEELLEDLALILRADADAVILYPDMQDLACALGVPAIGGGFGADHQHAAFGRVLVGVADQVDEHLRDARAVTPNLGEVLGQ